MKIPTGTPEKILLRVAALQFGTGSRDELTNEASGGALEGMLHSLCSI
jgi:hypothetical protein